MFRRVFFPGACSCSISVGGAVSAVALFVPCNPQSPCQCEDKVRVSVLRHAESVANVIKKSNPGYYYANNWLDDSGNVAHERLRDCVLSEAGIASVLARAEEMLELDNGDGEILLVVSPLTRTILTASLLFFRLGSSRPVSVVIEPLASEKIYGPHDIIENIGRPMDEVFAEAEELLSKINAPGGCLDILRKLKDASQGMDRLWWFHPTSASSLPVKVLESKADERRTLLKDAVKKHIKQRRNISKVYIVCHWGVVKTLTGRIDAHNLQCVDLDDFWTE